MQSTPKSVNKPKTDNKYSHIGTKSSKIITKPMQMTHLPSQFPLSPLIISNHSSQTSSNSSRSNSPKQQYPKSTINIVDANHESMTQDIIKESTRTNSSGDITSVSISTEAEERQLGPPKHTTKSQKMYKAFKKQQSISPIEIINQSSDEVKALSNSVETEDFYDYTRTCMKMIVNISTIDYIPPAKVTFPFEGEKKRLAVFDLDETLVHCLVKDYDATENIIEVPLPSKQTAKIGVMIRPHWEKAIKRIRSKYHIVIYTASHKSYADAVLDFLDPDKEYFPFRLYRNNCIMIKHEGQIIYVKDCSIFEDYDLKDVVLVDNSVLSFAYHLDNGIPITPYYDAKKDFELLFCACYLEKIAGFEDLRERNREILRLDQFLIQAIDEIKHEEEKKERKLLRKKEKEKEKEYRHAKSNMLYHAKKRRSKGNTGTCKVIQEEIDNGKENGKDKEKKRRHTVIVPNNSEVPEEKEIPCIGHIGFHRKQSNFCNDFEYDLQKLRTKFSDGQDDDEDNQIIEETPVDNNNLK